MSMVNWTNEEIHRTIEQIRQKAQQDKSFRELCIKDIDGAIRDTVCKRVPNGFNINVIDSTGYDLTVMLPPTEESGELSESELETVAGGNKEAYNSSQKAYQDYWQNRG